MILRSIHLLAAFLIAWLSFSGSNLRAQGCITVGPDSFDLGQVMVGGTVYGQFRIFVDQAAVIEVFPPDTSFVFSPSFPIAIGGLDSAVVNFTYTSRSFGRQDFLLILRDTAQRLTCSDTIRFSVTGIDTTRQDTTFSLQAGRENVLAFKTDESSKTLKVKIQNATGKELVIKSFLIDSSAQFSIEDVPVVPLILDPGATFQFEVYFTALKPGFYSTNIRLPNDGGLASEFTIGVQGLKLGVASVPPIRTKSGIRVMQSSNEIAIDGLPFDRGWLEIYDLLGRMIARHEINAREIMIPKRDARGMTIIDGGYLLRLSDESGQFNETVKVLLVSY